MKLSVVSKMMPFRFFYRPALAFWLLPWLMVLLVVGTLAQRQLGLYQTQQWLFNPWFFKISFLYLPSFKMTLAVLAASLCYKLCRSWPIRLNQCGSLITHAAVLVLLFGGFLAAAYNHTRFMIMAPNQPMKHVSDYHARELAIIQDGSLIENIPLSKVLADQGVALLSLPFKAHVLAYCENCEVVARRYVSTAHQGAASSLALQPVARQLADEKNHPGLTLSVQTKASEQIYMTQESGRVHPRFVVDGHTYELVLRKALHVLPFQLTLLNLTEHRYPGTNKASDYVSTVKIQDGTQQVISKIAMNQPLRYGGYTFYQSGVVHEGGMTLSELTVVESTGRLLPYIACGLFAIGLILQLSVRRRQVRQ